MPFHLTLSQLTRVFRVNLKLSVRFFATCVRKQNFKKRNIFFLMINLELTSLIQARKDHIAVCLKNPLGLCDIVRNIYLGSAPVSDTELLKL